MTLVNQVLRTILYDNFSSDRGNHNHVFFLIKKWRYEPPNFINFEVYIDHKHVIDVLPI
jgi:hypothetical protein